MTSCTRLNRASDGQTRNCSSVENRPLRWKDCSWNRPEGMTKPQLASDEVKRQKMTDGETASTLQRPPGRRSLGEGGHASTIPTRHRAFSLSRILAITR